VLLDWLKDLGCRLGLIRNGRAPSRQPRKITPRVTSLKDLMAELPSQGTRALCDGPCWSLEGVFEAAGVKPKAWTVERLRDLLRTESFQSMDRSAARQAILQALAVENASADDLVQDARCRDKALAEAEARALALVQQRQNLRKGQSEALERQIHQLHEASKALDSADQEDQQALRRWQAQKGAYARDMTWALGFLTENPAGIQADPKKS
jgi:hypothetical protein